ncbi:MAG TPA: HAMP domain-containing sensor histidine kinase [Candidatus Acidoferrales bacterium]|nr:HAMP domain-containing sensor histidine kinase [Candidatus Acidoferrales bacterium]
MPAKSTEYGRNLIWFRLRALYSEAIKPFLTKPKKVKIAPMEPAAAASGPLSKRQTVIILQWMIVIVSAYMMLFGTGALTEDLWIYGAVAALLGSALLLYLLPHQAFHHKRFDTLWLVADTALIAASIYIGNSAQWDLFLLFFLVLFLAGIGESLLRIVLASVIVNLVYVGFTLLQGKELQQLGFDIFIRIPFLFGVAILYGHLAESAKREKMRAEMLEERERLKMDLVSALAHDIKNPLGVIMGYAETVAAWLARREEGKENLEPLQRIQENAQRIVKLVSGFLDASGLEAGKSGLVQHPVDLNTLIREVGTQHMAELRKKDLDLVVDLDESVPEIMGNEGQLDRVLWNLIGNAIKFTPRGGTVTISSRRDTHYVSVSVKDTGIGMRKEEIPLLFSQYRRLKGAQKIEGTGLGLFIVKTIVEAHKGTVHVESEEGAGSTFTIRLPLPRN